MSTPLGENTIRAAETLTLLPSNATHRTRDPEQDRLSPTVNSHFKGPLGTKHMEPEAGDDEDAAGLHQLHPAHVFMQRGR